MPRMLPGSGRASAHRPPAAGRRGGPTALQGPGRRWPGVQGTQGWATVGVVRVVPGVLLEADLPGDGEWEDDKDAESREGEALVCVPGGHWGGPAQCPIGVQGVTHCRGGQQGVSCAPKGGPRGLEHHTIAGLGSLTSLGVPRKPRGLPPALMGPPSPCSREPPAPSKP